jgi:hypothetical protein
MRDSLRFQLAPPHLNAVVQGLADVAGHVIKCGLNPPLMN